MCAGPFWPMRTERTLHWGEDGEDAKSWPLPKRSPTLTGRSTNLMIVHVTEPFLVLPLFLNWHNGLRRFVCNQYACSHFILKMPVLCKCPLINSLNNFLSALAGAEEARNRSKKNTYMFWNIDCMISTALFVILVPPDRQRRWRGWQNLWNPASS